MFDSLYAIFISFVYTYTFSWIMQEDPRKSITRRVKQQVQYYEINLKNSFLGVEKLSFSLGLLLILY